MTEDVQIGDTSSSPRHGNFQGASRPPVVNHSRIKMLIPVQAIAAAGGLSALQVPCEQETKDRRQKRGASKSAHLVHKEVNGRPMCPPPTPVLSTAQKQCRGLEPEFASQLEPPFPMEAKPTSCQTTNPTATWRQPQMRSHLASHVHKYHLTECAALPHSNY